VTARQKERQLKEMLEGGADHVPRPYVDKKKFRFRFPPAPRSGKEVIAIEGVSHGYGGTTLFRDVDLLIERGDRIAILGPNGACLTPNPNPDRSRNPNPHPNPNPNPDPNPDPKPDPKPNPNPNPDPNPNPNPDQARARRRCSSSSWAWRRRARARPA